MDELFSCLLINARNRDDERCRQHEGTCFVAAETDLSDNFDIIVGEPEIGLAPDAQKCILEASRIAASKELLGIGCAALAAKLRR